MAILALNKATSTHALVSSKYTHGQRVWLKGKNLPISHGTIKLSPKQYGPFTIMKLISPVASQLDLPMSWNIHPVFHNSLLTPYVETNAHGPNFTRPPPNLIDGEAEYEVEAIRSHRYFGKNKKLQYLLKWKGYPEANNTWESEDHLNAPDLLKQYNRRHSLKDIKTQVKLARTHSPILEFHPYAYLSYNVDLNYTFLHYRMSSVNLSNESPASTMPSSPRLPILFNPVTDAASIAQLAPNYTPISPQTMVNILATQPDLNETVRTIAYGLVSTVHRREVAHTLEAKECDETNRVLQEKLKKYAEKIDRDFFLPGCPDGYKPNDGRVSTLIPVGEGFFVPAKFVKFRDDRRVLCLPGKEHHEEPYATDLFLSPDYSSQDITEPLPIWFNTLLNSPTPAYHTLHRAVADLDDWNATAKIERYRRQDDQLRHLHDKLTIIQAEVHLTEDDLMACQYCIKATRILTRIPNLEGRAWLEDYLARRRTLGRGAC
jgi:Chromo (CHRromatin Organisation MOdifier) domain